ncbi:hypothetical protein NW766_003964 [Fusarium irregulare]|uniref:Uncharacterized protein n=1 Tax=Fusarium irregulare TaxID=2494466 RepID=A0A9W8PU27_9HYPO|nr:hypothetical protein NW766_003964 [Fusarium irregulare]
MPSAPTRSDAPQDLESHLRSDLMDGVKALEERTTKQSSALTDLQVQDDNDEFTDEKLATAVEIDKRRPSAHVRYARTSVQRAPDQIVQSIETLISQSKGKPVDKEEDKQETVDDLSSSSLNKRTLPLDDTSEEAAVPVRSI